MKILRTDAPEFLDRPDCADADKVAIVSHLDRLNRALRAYHRFFAVLRPAILDVLSARTGNWQLASSSSIDMDLDLSGWQCSEPLAAPPARPRGSLAAGS